MTPSELRALCEKATKGPWEPVINASPDHPNDNCIEPADGNWLAHDDEYGDSMPADDARFIAAARTALPWTLDLLAKAVTFVEEQKYIPGFQEEAKAWLAAYEKGCP